MGKVNVNDISLAVAKEDGFGVTPTGEAYLLEPNEISNLGGTITTVARAPIGDRQRRKGTVTDFEAGVEFGSDITMGSARLWAPAFCLSPEWAGPGKPLATPQAAANGVYSVDLSSSGFVGTDKWALNGAIIKFEGFSNAANNGIKVVTAVAAGVTPLTNLTATGATVAETNAGAKATIVGIRFAAGALSWAGQSLVVTAAAIKSGVAASQVSANWEALGLQVGQWVFVGGDAAINRFDDAGNQGFFKVSSVAGVNLRVDGHSGNNNGNAKEVDLYFGQRVHNLSPDDMAFEELYYRFQATYRGLEANDMPGYEYIVGAAPNQWTISMPLTEKATQSFQFTAKEALRIVDAVTNFPATPGELHGTEAFNTSADFAKLRLSDGTLSSEAYFKSVELVVNNNYSPEKVLATTGAAFMNLGTLEVSGTVQAMFTDKALVNAILDNTTFNLCASLRNGDGAVLFEIPSVTLGGGQKEFPVNETVRVGLEASAFRDETYNDSVNINLFGWLPELAAA